MATYRRNNGSIITDQNQKGACERLLSEYLRIAVSENIEADFSETHVGSFAFEDVEVAASVTDYAIKGWDDFYLAYRKVAHDFPFVVMDNGYAYEYHEGDGDYTLAFDPDTLGESEVDAAYPLFFENPSKAAMRHNVPAWLREIVIETPEHIHETGVYTREGYCTIGLGIDEDE